MASSARVFISSYLIRDNDRSVGVTVKSVVDGEIRNGKIIGFDMSPDVSKYTKIIQTSGDASLDGIIIPDAKLLVKIDDFFKGSFLGVEVKREVKLRKTFNINRGGRKVSIFTLERVRFEKASNVKIDFSALKKYVGGDG